MSNEIQILAWKKHPEPNGVLYSSEDLLNEEAIIELFNSCEHSEAYITSDGWEFLFGEFGLKKLLEINMKSTWVDHDAPIAGLIYQSLIAGYNPVQNEKGDYDPDTEFFLTLDGLKCKVDWNEIRRQH